MKITNIKLFIRMFEKIQKIMKLSVWYNRIEGNTMKRGEQLDAIWLFT